MKTAVFYGGTDIRVEDRPVPGPGQGEVLVRIRAAGICGSDLRHYRLERPDASYPMRAGHELSGEVVAVGPDVTALAPGRRVGIEPLHLLGCGRCRQCRQGAYHICPNRGMPAGHSVHSSGFSEFDVAPVSSVYSLPDTVSFEEAALLDVYGVAVHGVHRVSVRPIDTVVVVGTGAVGLTQGQVARALGARLVIMVGRREGPLQVAQACGAADVVVDASTVSPTQAVLDLTHGAGADVVFETSGGRSTIQLCCDLAGFGGRVGISGLFPGSEAIDTSTLMRKELDLCWINSYSTWDGVSEYELALGLVVDGRVQAGALVSHRVSLDEIAQGFAWASEKAASGATKVMVVP
jgi:threonine dehydrogenase-like Zn-dependent dehydrogenase